MKTYKEISLKKYSNIKIGGIAKELVFPENISELELILEKNRDHEIIGNCSNILFSDDYIDKTFISSKLLKGINETENGLVEVYSGVLLSELLQYMRRKNYSGLEPLIGIPATIGGLTYMNGGAHGVEIFDYIQKVEIIDENKNRTILEKSEIENGYRYTEFKDRKVFITRTYFDFDEDFDEEKINGTMTNRLKSQPLDLPNIGSIFQNPQEDYAARLIEDLDLKGYKIGGAMISNKHSNFIVNTGSAKSEDVINLIESIKEKVYKNSNINLKEEIIKIPEGN